MEACALQVTKNHSGLHTICSLRDDVIDEVLGEAVISEEVDAVRLHGIFVKPEHRGKGHGTSLMETVLSLGDGKTITLCTGLGNVSFFRRFGFEVTEIGDSLVSMEKLP
jgi:predicted N-acetyltransferase YhbS